MAPRSTTSTAETAEQSPLYHHARYDAYECLGCQEMIEIPRRAVLEAGRQAEAVKGNPENMLRWVELMELDHKPCTQFSDSRMAEQAREHRQPVLRTKTA